MVWKKEPRALEWVVLGGNNRHQAGGNSYLYSLRYGSVIEAAALIDLGVQDIAEQQQQMPDIDPFFQRPAKERAIFLTSAAPAHAGGVIHYVNMGAQKKPVPVACPPIYASEITLALLKENLLRLQIAPALWPALNVVHHDEVIQLGELKITAVESGGDLPGRFAFLLEGAGQKIMHVAGFSRDDSLIFSSGNSLEHMAEHQGIDLLLLGGAKGNINGSSPKESASRLALENIVRQHSQQRLVVSLYPSQIERIASVVGVAHGHQRNVLVTSPTIQAGLLSLKRMGLDLSRLVGGENSLLLDARSQIAKKLPPEKTMILVAATAGEQMDLLSRAVNDELASPLLHLQVGDVVVIAEAASPKRREALKSLIDALRRKGMVVYMLEDEQETGENQAFQDDISGLLEVLQPDEAVPIQGSEYMLAALCTFLRQQGVNATRFTNGAEACLSEAGVVKLGQHPITQVTIKGDNPTTPVYDKQQVRIGQKFTQNAGKPISASKSSVGKKPNM